MTLTVTGTRSTALLSIWWLGSCLTREAAVHGFAPNPQTPCMTRTSTTKLYTASFQNQDNFDNNVVASSKIVGNFGFDPMHLAGTKEQLVHYRQAEIKHARLAMLVSLFWVGCVDVLIVDEMIAA